MKLLYHCSSCGVEVYNRNKGSKVKETCAVCLADEKAQKLQAQLAKHKAKREDRKESQRSEEAKLRQQKELERREAAQKELARRELARNHIIPFITRFKPNYQVGWVHKVFAAELERFYHAVEAGEQPRLMVFVPPRHGKSEIISNNFPSWVLGRRPDWEVIMASYTVNLPLRFSKANRSRIKDKAYRAIFPETELDKDSTSAEEWLTTKRGGLKCAGVGGGLSGFGANILIIDDPIKDYEDAQSKTILETVKNWYTTVAETRLAPDGGVIIVQTRWSDDDLSGWQLRQDKENKELGYDDYLQNWRVVSFPAIAEHDEYIDPNTLDFFDEPAPGRALIRRQNEVLHPDRYDMKYLMRKKISMPTNQWSALFQQNPVPASGDFFREEDFMYYDSVPVLHDCPVVFSWDLAIGEKRNNDYTVGMAGVVIPQQGVNCLYLLDMYRNRVRDLQQLEAIVSMYAKYKHNAYRLGVEQGAIWLAIEKRLKAMFEERKLSPVFDDTLVPVRDKRVRATPLQGWMQNHRVYFPRHQPWTQKAKEELLRFDAGVNDDVVDALAWLVRMVQNMSVIEPKKKKQDGQTLKELLADYARSQRDSGKGYMAA